MSHLNELPPVPEPLDEMLPEPTADFVAERRAMVSSFDSYVVTNQQRDGRVGRLTALQTETFLKVRDFVAGNLTHGLLQLACGYGKSAIATTAADALGAGRERPGGGRRQALLSTSRNAIVQQFVNRNIQYTESNPDEDNLTELLSDFDFFAPRLDATMYNKFDKNLEGDVVVTPYQSLGNLIRGGIITPNRFPIYFLDESQHLGKKRQQLLETLGEHGLFLGLSATPGRSREFLPTVIDKISMADGILKYGFLSDIKMHGLPTDCTFTSRGQANGDYLARDTEQLAGNPERNKLIVEQIYEYASAHGPGLVKCSRQLQGEASHIQTIANLANQNAPSIVRNGKRRKLRVEAVSASIKGSADILEEFIHGNSIDVLTFVDLIGEGFNMPRAKWGIWTPPTMSLNALEQFIGRGVRLDAGDPEKVFHFLQLLDTNLATNNNALGWELFDLPRDIVDVTVSKDSGINYTRRSAGGTSEKQSIAVTDNVSAERIKGLALDTTMRAPAIEGQLTSLTAIQEALVVDRDLLKRVLFDGGFTAYPHVVDEVAVLAYQSAALEYAEQAIARPEDKTVRQVAREFGMEEGVLMRWLHLHDAAVTMLYPRNSKIARRQIHMKPDQFASFEQKLTANVRPLSASEITLRDACEQAQATLQTSRTKNFLMRGFSLEDRKITIGRKSQLIGVRSEIIPWITAYKNARPAPAAGFTPLLGFVKVRFGSHKPLLEDIYIAAYNLKLKPQIFIRGGRERTDFIEEHNRNALIHEITAVMQQRVLAQQDPSVPMPAMGGCIYGSDPSVTREGSDKKQSKGQQANKASADSDARDEDAEDIPQEGNLDVVPIKLQRAIMSRHHAFRTLNPRSEIYDEQAANVLQRVINGVTTPFPPIPRTWVFLGDLAPELNLAEQALVNLLITKQISPNHACFIDINGINGLLGFCSPELANLLRTKG